MSTPRTLPSRLAVAAIPLAIALVVLFALLVTADQLALAMVTIFVAATAIPVAMTVGRFQRSLDCEVARVRILGSLDLGDIDDPLAALSEGTEGAERRLAALQASHDRVLLHGTSALFTTLAVQSASAVDDQLRLLQRLTADCTDAAMLEGYYELDRLAMQLRSSVGIDRSLGDGPVSREPQAVGDIVKSSIAALRRPGLEEGPTTRDSDVDVAAIDAALVSGDVADDLTFVLGALLHELAALAPTTSIRIDGWQRDHEYTVVVTATGVELTPEQRSRVAEIISSSPVLGTATDLFGFSIAAALVERHGLEANVLGDATGLAISVRVPSALMYVPSEGDRVTVPGPRTGALSIVRPFMMADGRTSPSTYVDPTVQVLRSTRSEALDAARAEAMPILELLERPMTPIDVAAELGLPVGVAMVLIGDLITQDLLIVHRTATTAVRASMLEQALDTSGSR